MTNEEYINSIRGAIDSFEKDGHSTIQIVLWFMCPNRWCKGLRPFEALEQDLEGFRRAVYEELNTPVG